MIAKWTFFLVISAGIGLALALGCQTYNFEPVTPLAVSQTTQSKTITARQDKANTTLVFDRSGSLWLPIDSTVPACRLDGGAGTCGQNADDCPVACVTRDRAIKSAMNTFLTNSGTVARLGMITFPSTSNECAPGTVRVDIPTLSDDATLNAKAAQINAILAASSPAGGTPTSASLALLASYPGLQDPNILNTYVLVTDGVPNCNAANPNDACNPYPNPACQCTIVSSGGGDACCPYPPPNPQPNPYRRLGCLDQDTTVGTMANLRTSRTIRGFVLGVGDETLGNGTTLNAMAEAGGFPRACPNGTNAECGTNNPCITATRKCTREYYQAGSPQDLANALEAIRGLLVGDPCTFTLNDTPSDPLLLAVLVNNQSVARGPDTWAYLSTVPPKVVFAPTGAICNQLKNSTPSNPVILEFRILQT